MNLTPRIGLIASNLIWIFLIAYALVTGIGLLSLQSPLDPIGDPWFTIMELLIIFLAPLMLIAMIALDQTVLQSMRIFSKTALFFMALMTAVTCGVHFTVLTVSRLITAAGYPGADLLFSFTWPSVAYTLDILAWDFFFALSILFAAPIFLGADKGRVIGILMLLSGLLSLAGLAGIPTADMGIRNIGIVGYAVVTIPLYLLLARWFRSDGK